VLRSWRELRDKVGAAIVRIRFCPIGNTTGKV
jgi:hypothetical protein